MGYLECKKPVGFLGKGVGFWGCYGKTIAQLESFQIAGGFQRWLEMYHGDLQKWTGIN